MTLLCLSCQSVKDYNNYLVESSVVSEIPTLMGNILGGASTAPLLLFTVPLGYVACNDDQQRKDFISTPLKWGAYGGGVILGTPFLPAALLSSKKSTESSASSSK